MSLEDAGGFYNTEVTLDDEVTRKREVIDRKTVPYPMTSVTFTGLDPQDSFSVSVRTVVTDPEGVAREGPTSEPLVVTPNDGQEPPTEPTGGNSAISQLHVTCTSTCSCYYMYITSYYTCTCTLIQWIVHVQYVFYFLHCT